MATAADNFIEIKLKDIVSNTAQSRGMGALPTLQSMGYGLFEKLPEHDDKEPIWSMLMSNKAEEKKEGLALITQNEGHILDKAESLSTTGQLQNIVVVPAKGQDGKWDVVAGMLRCIAFAFNHARDPKAPDSLVASVREETKEKDLIFLALDENGNREGESPIDRALTYKRLKEEFKMSTDDIAKRIGKSGQHVRDHINKLLDPIISDKLMEIHNGELTIDKAIKMVQKRKKGNKEDDAKTTGKNERARMPSVKKLTEAYQAKQKPKWMDQAIWELFVKEDVRRWLAKTMKLKYKPFSGELVTAEPEPDDAEAGYKIGIPRKKAVRLLKALGKENADNWEDSTLASKLEGIVNLAEDDTKLEDESLQGLLDKLLKNYSKGIKVTIKPPEAAA